jgi:hypothetical protein
MARGACTAGCSVDVNLMPDKTYPLSIRLTRSEREQLGARAHLLSANVNSVARELIRTGIAGGDYRGLAEQLRQLERRLVVMEQRSETIDRRTAHTEKSADKILAMFADLLKALTEGENP